MLVFFSTTVLCLGVFWYPTNHLDIMASMPSGIKPSTDSLVRTVCRSAKAGRSVHGDTSVVAEI